jgi:hypothetical protein
MKGRAIFQFRVSSFNFKLYQKGDFQWRDTKGRREDGNWIGGAVAGGNG